MLAVHRHFIVLTFFTCVGFAFNKADAALIDRGSGLLYDDVLNITWLQDTNYAKTSGYDVDGRLSSVDALNWATNLNYFDSVRRVTYSDWRLPRNSSDGHPFHYGWWFAIGDDHPTTGPHSELSYMYYINLGLAGYQTNYGAWQDNFGIFGNNTFTGQTNIGLIKNLQAGEYFSYAAPSPYPYDQPWTFNTNTGNHYVRLKYEPHFAWAVHDGDIAAHAIPEPKTETMMLLGIGMIGFYALRRKSNFIATKLSFRA